MCTKPSQWSSTSSETDDHYHEPLQYTSHSHSHFGAAAAAASRAAATAAAVTAAAAVDRFALNLFGMLTNVLKMGAQHVFHSFVVWKVQLPC